MVTNLNLSYPQALGLLKNYCFPPVRAGRVRARGRGGFACSCSLLLFAFSSQRETRAACRIAFFKLNIGVIAATDLQEWQQEQHQEQRGLITSLCLSTGTSPASLPPYGHIHTGGEKPKHKCNAQPLC